MLPILIAIPFLSIIGLLQSSIMSRITLLSGKADLILLIVIAWAIQPRVKSRWQWAVVGGIVSTLISALPAGTILLGYLLSVYFAALLQRWSWKLPLLSLTGSTFIATILLHGISFLAVFLKSGIQPLQDVLNWIFLPSLLLNLLLALPVFIIVRDMAAWLYPEELKA